MILAVVLLASGLLTGLVPSASADPRGSVYTTPGKQTVNGHQWRTTCEKYSSNVYRCQEDIWATQVRKKPAGTGYIAATQHTVTAVKTSATRATVTMVERVAGTRCDTRMVFRDTTGRFGYGGATPAATRRQDTRTTPSGVFTVKDAFGIKASPWTELTWRNVGPDSYWVLDSKSRSYNQWRDGAVGGFNKRNSEHLITYPGEYDYAAVIDYNRSPAIKGKGGPIFLHVHGKGATAGCVSITEANMKAYLRNVGAGDTIVIG